MDIHKKLGMIVKQAREEKRWTQQDLAYSLKIELAAVREIEDGHGNPEYTTIAEMVFLLEICPNVLFSEAGGDDSVKLDRLYRELLHLPQGQYEDLVKSASRQRSWYAEHPDARSVDDYWEVVRAAGLAVDSRRTVDG